MSKPPELDCADKIHAPESYPPANAQEAARRETLTEELMQQGALSTGANYPVVPQPVDQEFIDGFNRVAERIYEWSVRKGFWPDGDRNDGEAFALMHSEISEALECLRFGNPPDKNLPEYSGAQVQIGDAIMRIMDWCHGRGLNVAESIFAKMEFNETREYKNGKEF